MDVSAQAVKELRDKTGAGFMDCKVALKESQGNVDRAIAFLREKGLAQAGQKAGRVASEGLVDAYIHPGGKIGVLVEVNCETDFVARTPEFKALVRDLAMHVAASSPLWLAAEEVPPETLERERKIYHQQALNEGRPEKVVGKIVEGRLEKYLCEVVLLRQNFVKDPNLTIEQLLKAAIARVGENIVIRRFARFHLGESAS